MKQVQDPYKEGHQQGARIKVAVIREEENVLQNGAKSVIEIQKTQRTY